MTKMTYFSKDKLHTTTLVFTRREGLDISTIGIASVITVRKISVQEALKKLKVAVTDWVKNTQSGRKCYESSGGQVLRVAGSVRRCTGETLEFHGGDLNIGDLSLYEQQFTAGINNGFLRKQGILAFSIQYVGEVSEGTFSYDHVLFKE